MLRRDIRFCSEAISHDTFVKRFGKVDIYIPILTSPIDQVMSDLPVTYLTTSSLIHSLSTQGRLIYED